MKADQLIWNIAQLEYSLFVVNSYAAGIQQNDGRYITKYFPMSPFVIEQMLLRQGSMGCYQQGYKTNRINGSASILTARRKRSRMFMLCMRSVLLRLYMC